MAIELKPSRIASLLAQPVLDQPLPAAQARPEAAFVWGQGGQRMTPEEIAMQRQRAAELGRAGMDYSPLGHWTQGLARMADGFAGGLDARHARKAGETNAAESRSIAEILAGDAVSDEDVIAAAGNPYIDPVARALAESMRAERVELNKPQYFMSGNDRVMFDPSSGQSRVLYQGQSDAEDYAASLGLKPGTPDFNTAMRDYVLRANGPTAYGYDVDLENARQGNRETLEGIRQRNRLSLRQTPTYGQANPRPNGGGSGRPSRVPTLSGTMAPILAKVSRGEPLTAGEQQAWVMYRPGRTVGSGRGSQSDSGPTATDPSTGRKVRWNGKAWVPTQ